MCNVAVLEFFIENMRTDEFKGKSILEAGSRYINGSVRPLIKKFFSPSEYVGVNIEFSKFIDLILPAEKLLECFSYESFDAVISMELLKHVVD